MSQLPYFLSDFIIFAPICREIFMLSFEIMVILDWTSPLRHEGAPLPTLCLLFTTVPHRGQKKRFMGAISRFRVAIRAL